LTVRSALTKKAAISFHESKRLRAKGSGLIAITKDDPSWPEMA